MNTPHDAPAKYRLRQEPNQYACCRTDADHFIEKYGQRLSNSPKNITEQAVTVVADRKLPHLELLLFP